MPDLFTPRYDLNYGCHWLPQTEFVFDHDWCRLCDDVIEFWDFKRQFSLLMQAYGFDALPDSIMDKKRNSHRACKYNQSTIAPEVEEMAYFTYKTDYEMGFGRPP